MIKEEFNNYLNAIGDPLITPPTLLVDKFSNFLDAKKLTNQLEKQIKGRQNVGFVDSAFENMMRSVGWRTSNAWCAFYVKLVLMQMFSFDREWLAKNLTGSSLGNLDNVKKANARGDRRYVAFTSGQLQVGDVFVTRRTKGGHTGIIYKILNDKTNEVETIEGNTNTARSGEGDKVLRLKRKLVVGQKTGSQTTVGFFRRNFTEEEVKKLQYDEQLHTFVFV
jgi:hypothetical protein